MGITTDDPTSEALVCETLSAMNQFGELAYNLELTNRLEKHNLSAPRMTLGTNETYSGPSSVWRQSKLSGTMLSNAMSISTVGW